MDALNDLWLGFEVALSLDNLFYALMGCLVGTLIGVLPGLGPVATIAMLLPLTYNLPPVSALIMLSGIYYGAQYGGSTTAILINLPGESTSVVTTLDGYQMAKQGRGGVALAISALGSFFAGSVSTLMIACFSIPLIKIAFLFGPAEYFALMLFGLIGAVVLSSGSLIKSLCMVSVGLLLGLVGTDVNSGIARYTLDIPALANGIDFVIIAMGIFGFGEIIYNLTFSQKEQAVNYNQVGQLMPSRADFKAATPAILRGTLVGSLLGILPGGGALLASFASYTLEKKITKQPNIPFGQGNIRGVAAPESANNAGAQTSFIPLLTLGIPGNAVMALMLGAMTIHNIVPGPQVMSSNPVLFWGLIASMWIGNFILVILNLPLIRVWVKLLTIPYRFLFPAILVFCIIGVYSINNSVFDLWLVALFGLVGFIFKLLDFEPAPLLLGLILGPMMEENLRRTLLLSDGRWAVFIERPISLGLLLVSLLLILVLLFPLVRKRRQATFIED